MSEHVAVGKITAQAAEQGYAPFLSVLHGPHSSRRPRSALAKLTVFSLALGIVPLGSYFLSQKYLWGGECRSAFWA